MDIVDSQVHIGPGGISEMVAAIDALGIRSVLFDEYWIGTPGHPAYRVNDKVFRPTVATAELAAWMHPDRFSYLLRVEHYDPELRSIIRQQRDASHCRALRISPGMNRAETAAFANGDHEGVFAGAAECGLPIFVQISGNTDLLAPYLTKFPEVKVIICHTGMPPGKALIGPFASIEGLPDSLDYWTKVANEPTDDALDKVLRTADHPNVAVKWAHAPTMFNTSSWPSEELRPYFHKMVGAFGSERVMWASDISANQTGESWAELMFWVRNDPKLSDAEKADIMGGTARKWLNWEAS